jgi:nucleosome binding factor SPN SPT16 subunit
LKIINESDNNYLKPDIIRLSLGGKYFELNCNVIRTLIINPTEDEQKAYTALISLFNELQNNLKNGQNIG